MRSPSHPAAAAAPSHNAVVRADAGTGKTWLLTSRLIRLLLDGVEPGAILAITFTRKAAAEIQQRLARRLFELATVDDAALDALLAQIGAPAETAVRARARALYETFIDAEPALRAMTFHAFCQDLLERFPLEAGVPPGFELLEDPQELVGVAWCAFDREITRAHDTALIAAADTLLRACTSPRALQSALTDFIAHRSDWWAYTEDHRDPVAHAVQTLRRALHVDQLPETIWGIPVDLRMDAAYYGETLARLDSRGAQQRAAQLRVALVDAGADAPGVFHSLWETFFTRDGSLRVLQRSRAMCNQIGDDAADGLIAQHRALGDRLRAIRAAESRRQTFELSRAWYVCGQWLLEHFQGLKAEAGLLDFADLEWLSYRLLRRSPYTEWVQYKLDRRIDHLLIDEFQDTNPTQWRLLLPLLEEMAAGDAQRPRSVFLVGDEKQSIYRFRRAEPALFRTAHDWLANRMQARSFGQHVSWRAAPAIIDFVNLLFEVAPAQPAHDAAAPPAADYALPDFRSHATRHTERWGQVEVLPLIAAAPPVEDAPATLRDPLATPRVVPEDVRHRAEGDLICARIRTLLGETVVGAHGPRPLDYGDIVILLRDRSHAQDYEDALRDADIPYLGTGRGGFHASREVQDLIELLRLLRAPYDDLALATVLRSPLFGASEAELIVLARPDDPPTWYARLLRLHGPRPGGALARARELLERWQGLVDRVPVHDLLDRLYFEGDVIARYRAAAPPHLQARVEANLRRVLPLALEVGAGRYPSLGRFLRRLEAAGAADDTPVVASAERRVRVMTIHAAKGLEAPAVFLANAAAVSRAPAAGLRALVEWPVDAERPRLFHLIGRQDALDELSAGARARRHAAEQREEANLLYVALTRAQQWLFVSGVAPRGARRGWYGFIEARLRTARAEGSSDSVGLRIEQRTGADGDSPPNIFGTLARGVRSPRPEAPPRSEPPLPALDLALTQPVPSGMEPSARRPSADSETLGGTAARAARRRGTLLHRILQELSEGRPGAMARARLQNEWPDLPEFDELWAEATRVAARPELRRFLNPAGLEAAYNELPILYESAGGPVYGVMDRVVLSPGEVTILDYKTDRDATPDNLAERAAEHHAQLRLYAAGVARLWPQRRVRAYLVYTVCGRLIEVPLT